MNTIPENSENTPSAAAWAEWKEVCTIGKCGASTAEALAHFGRKRLAARFLQLKVKKGKEKLHGAESLVEAYCGTDSHQAQAAWCQFERLLRIDGEDGTGGRIREKDGKSYKEAMFANGCPAGYATLAFHGEIARKIAKEEGLSPVSLDQPVGRDGTCTLLDVIADCRAGECESIYGEPAGESDDPDLLDRVRKQAKTLWDGWDEKNRAIFCDMLAVDGRLQDAFRLNPRGLGQSAYYERCKNMRGATENGDWLAQGMGKYRRAYIVRLVRRELLNYIAADRNIASSDAYQS